MAAGMDDYLTKPIKMQEMYSVIARRLGKRAAGAPARSDSAVSGR